MGSYFLSSQEQGTSWHLVLYIVKLLFRTTPSWVFLLSRTDVIAPSLQHFVLYWGPICVTAVGWVLANIMPSGSCVILYMLGHQMRAEIEVHTSIWYHGKIHYASLLSVLRKPDKQLYMWRRQSTAWSLCEKCGIIEAWVAQLPEVPLYIGTNTFFFTGLFKLCFHFILALFCFPPGGKYLSL